MNAEERAIQEVLDRAAYFNLLAVSDRRLAGGKSPRGASAPLTSVRFQGAGHRFDVTVHEDARGELRARNIVGGRALRLSFQWLPIPDDFVVTPGSQPPPTPLDTSRSQRFALLDGEFVFGSEGRDRFRSMGSGRTFPLDPRSVRLAGIGNVLEPTGQFSGLQGIYVFSGVFRPPDDFRLSILIRFNDPQGGLLASGALPRPRQGPVAVRDSTFLTFRTFADPAGTRPVPTPSGLPPAQAFTAPETTTQIHVDFAETPRGDLRSSVEIGADVGRHTVRIWIFPSPSATGTPLAPIPFFDEEEFVFIDRQGETTGSLRADVIEGRAILSPLPGVPQQMMPQLAAGFAFISDGTGQFAGCRGMVTNVGVGTVGPHLSSLLYVFEIFGPSGRFRAR